MSNSPALQQLNETVDQYRRRYLSLPPRDRALVNITVVTLFLMFVWLAVVAPAQRMRGEAALKLSGQQATLQWVRENEARALAIAGKTSASPRKSGQSLMAAVTSSSGQMGLTLKRYEPEGQEKLRVWLENQSFNKTIQWVDSLQRQHGMSVVNIAIDASSQPGLVNAKIVLRG
jgi:general secretion pathway protein M